MTSDDEFRRQLDDYLEAYQGETPLPDRVRDAVAAGLPGTRQVHAGAGRWKGPTMSPNNANIPRWGLVAAGFVVAVGLGAAIVLPGSGSGGGAAVASPTLAPSPAPTAAPSPSEGSALRTLEGAPHESCQVKRTVACIIPGTYLFGAVAPGGTIDVPAGWWEWDPGAGSVGVLVEHADAPGGSGWGLTLIQVGTVRRDPCDRGAGTFAPEDVDTPAKLAAVMATWPGFEVTSPDLVEVGGIEGVQVRLTTTLEPADCMAPMLWETPSNTAIDAYPMLAEAGVDPGAVHPADLRIIELDGQMLAIRTMSSARTSPRERTQGIPDDPTRHEADMAAVQAMIDSIRFGVSAP